MKQVKFTWDEQIRFGIVVDEYLNDLDMLMFTIDVPELDYHIELSQAKAVVC